MKPGARQDWAELHQVWVSVGFDPERFWRITPLEVDREMNGARQRLEREADERMTLAWHIVALDRTKRLPKLHTLLFSSGNRKQRPQTPEEHVLALKTIFLAFGGNPEELKTIQ